MNATVPNLPELDDMPIPNTTGRTAGGPGPVRLDVPRFEQPDDVTCGPTCLAQVYRYYGHAAELDDVIEGTPRNPDGGTLGVYLGLHALSSGFRPTIYSYNLRVFDPTWWGLDRGALVEKLRRRHAAVRSKRLRSAVSAYIRYLEGGGELRFDELTRELPVRLLRAGAPIVTGLSATYLYGTPRERENEYDDVRGDPVGHFVVICGYDPATDRFSVTDPSRHTPFGTGRYAVDAERLIAAILLGDITYDAVLLVLSGMDDGVDDGKEGR